MLYQGRYTDGMGLSEAILATRYLPTDVALVFRGYGAYEDTMRQVIAREGLEDRVTLVPPVPMNDLVFSAVGADLGLVVYNPINLNNVYAAPNKLFGSSSWLVFPALVVICRIFGKILCGSGFGSLVSSRRSKRHRPSDNGVAQFARTT